VEALAEKFKLVQSDIVRLDFDSFTEPEKQLFRKIWEIWDKYGSNPPADVLEANREFFSKAAEVLCGRVFDLFMFLNRELLGEDEIEYWYFKLHFWNFLADLNECLQRVRKWSEKDRQEFLKDMKEHDAMNKVFRIPRGSGGEDLRKRGKKQECKGNG